MKRQRSQSCEPSNFDTPPELIRQQSERPISDQNSILATIVNHNLIKDISIIDTFKEKDNISLHKKHFVNYVIKIKTDYFDYTISKRYSEFEKLYDQVFLKLNEIGTILHSLPKFPEKKLIKSNSKKNIAERREVLECINSFYEEILKHILKHLNNQMHNFLNFLNIQQQFLKVGFAQDFRVHELSKDEFGLSDLRDITKITAANDQEKMVFHYIAKLNDRYDERSKIFQKMEKYFFGKTQFLGQSILKFMLIGDDSNQKGIIELLKNTSQDSQSHISCTSGTQFLRKMLEYDYNPYADFFQRVFSELSIKQLKKMGIPYHICGSNKQLCKQDTLLIIYKYVKANELKPEFIQFLLEEKEAIQEFRSFEETQQYKKEEAFQLIIESSENMQRDNAPTKSNSKEQAHLLEQDPTMDQLQEIRNNDQLNWKLVQEYENHTIQHIQGQLVRTIHKLKCDLKRALEIMTTEKHRWLSTMIQRQVIKQIDENTNLVFETFLWQDKQLYKKVVFFSEEKLTNNEDGFEIQVTPIAETAPYESLCKFDEISYKILLCYGSYHEGTTTITILQNLFDKVQQLQYTPIFLKEVNYFEKTVQQLQILEAE